MVVLNTETLGCEHRDPGQLQDPTDHSSQPKSGPESKSGLVPTKCTLCRIYHDRWGPGLVRLVEAQEAGAAEPSAEFSIQDICRLALLFSFLSRGAERSPGAKQLPPKYCCSRLHCFSDGFCLLHLTFRPPSHHQRRASRG